MGKQNKRCTVVFDDGIDFEEAEKLVESFRQFKGVKRVEADLKTSTRVPGKTEEPKSVGKPQRLDFYDRMQTQRELIDHALVWGVQNGLVELEDLKKMSPEKLVEKALGLIDRMPEEQKVRMGEQLQRYYGQSDPNLENL